MKPMEVDVNANLTFVRGGFLHRTRFVLVNDRVPRTDGHCALCGSILEKGYVRDSQTRLIFVTPAGSMNHWLGDYRRV